MASRAEITTRYANAYVAARKKDRGRMLDEVISVTGWSRDNARRRLVAAAQAPPSQGRTVAATGRRPRAPKYSYDALKVLQVVWAATGGQCGKYLAVSMRTQLDALETHGELVADGMGRLDPRGRYNEAVRAELLSMSAATIDQYLAPAKAEDGLRGTSTTKPSPLLRSTITIRRAGDEVEAEPGFFEGDSAQMRTKPPFSRTRPMVEWSSSGMPSVSTTCFSSSRSDHRSYPGGGVEHAKAITLASTSPVTFGATGGVARCGG